MNRIIKTTRYEQGSMSLTVDADQTTATVDDGHGGVAHYTFLRGLYKVSESCWRSDFPIKEDEARFPTLLDLGRYFLGEGFEL